MIEPDSTTPVIILAILILLHALFASAKEAISFTRKSQRQHLIEQGNPSARVVDRLAENTNLLLTTEQIALKFLGGLTAGLAVLFYTGSLAEYLRINVFASAIIIISVTALILLVLGELIPKEIGRSYPETIAFSSLNPIIFLSYVAEPLAYLVARIGRVLTGRWDEDEEVSVSTITEDDLRLYVDVGEEEGLLKEGEREMIYSIFNLGDTFAREVMVPRVDVVAIEVGSSVTSAMETIMNAGHSRVPVYDDTIDNIVGILYVKDLLAYWLKEGTPTSVQGLVREVYYVPENKPVSDLLRELQKKKVHIAIVVDEYGGTAGLVTIEDVLEEIVGEIQDEHDAEEFFMQRISDDEYIFSARMDLDDINDIMSVELPTEDSDTLGGLIYDALGRIPDEGEILNGNSFDVPNLIVTVLDVEGRRIKTARIKRIREVGQPSESSETSTEASSSSSSTLVGKAHNTVS